MQRLVPVLRTMVESCTKGIDDGRGFENQKARVWGVVIDFMSLPQRGYTSGYVPDEMGPDGKVIKSNDDRTPYQLARFGGGLSAYTGLPTRAPYLSPAASLALPLQTTEGHTFKSHFRRGNQLLVRIAIPHDARARHANARWRREPGAGGQAWVVHLRACPE